LIRIAVCQANRQFYFAGESGKGVAFLNGKWHVLKIKKWTLIATVQNVCQTALKNPNPLYFSSIP
jgi:hypothetical protein